MKEKILSYIKKHREEVMLYTILVLPIAFLPLIYSLSSHSFIVDGKFAWIKMVDYYIELLAAVGAAFLGLIATLQNQRLQNLEERADNRANSCNIYIENVVPKANGYFENAFSRELLEEGINYLHDWLYIGISIENFSDAFLKDIEITFENDILKSRLTLTKSNKKEVNILLPRELEESKQYICKIVFNSCYNVKTYGDFKVEIPKKPEQGQKKVDISNYHFYGTEKPKN